MAAEWVANGDLSGRTADFKWWVVTWQLNGLRIAVFWVVRQISSDEVDFKRWGRFRVVTWQLNALRMVVFWGFERWGGFWVVLLILGGDVAAE